MNEETDSSTDNNKYRIEARSDGFFSVSTTLDSDTDIVRFSKSVPRILNMLSIGQIISKIESYCTRIDDTAILPKSDDMPDDLRLAGTAAISYPEGLPDKTVQENLGIKPNSRKAYVNSPQKRTSKYLSYDAKTKRVHINLDGIKWVLSELESQKHEPSRGGKTDR